MLIASASLLGLVVLAGIGLAALAMLRAPSPARLGWLGGLHGIGGIAGVLLLVLALLRTPPTPRAIRMGAAAFGIASATLVGAAMTVGLVILLHHQRHRANAPNLVVIHSMLAIAGYTLLVSYLSMLH